VARTDEHYPSPGRPDATDRAVRFDQEPGERPRPGSRKDLQDRLDRLPPGHPSSPYNADGSRRPPPPRLRDYELPPPHGKRPPDPDPDPDPDLTPVPRPDDSPRETIPSRLEPFADGEHAEHIRYVEQRLEWARSEKLATDYRYTTDPDRAQWAPERAVLHRDLLDDLSSRATDVPCDRQAIMAGGLGGAGKTTVLEGHAGVDRSQYLTINPDDIKEEMAKRGLIPEVPGLTPMEASDLVHEETSYLAKQFAARVVADGKNVIWDITMSSRSSTESRIDNLKNADYRTMGTFVDIPVEVGVRRADGRHREGHEDYRNGEGEGGRYVPADVIRSQADPEWGSVNRRTFEQGKEKFDQWAVYDNSVDGRAPVLIDASGEAREPKGET
jgi:predicted kinase